MINLNCKQHFSTLQLLRIQQSGLHLAAQQEGKQEEKTNPKKVKDTKYKEYLAQKLKTVKKEIKEIERETGFKITDSSFNINGICEKCKKERNY